MKRRGGIAIKTFVLAAIMLFYLFADGATVLARTINEPYIGYNYDFWANAVQAPNGYLPYKVVDGITLGISDLRNPTDFYVDKNTNTLYVLDAGNKRIILLDADYRLISVIDSFMYGDMEETISLGASGIFVFENGDIYIADTGNSRILAMDREGTIKKIYLSPESDLISSDIRYEPVQVGVDRSGIIYVCANNINTGLLTLDMDGNFIGFFGVARIQSSLVFIREMFWRMIMTDEQIARRRNFQPVGYGNFRIDDKGFVYATTPYAGAEMLYDTLKKLNPRGNDVLFERSYGDYYSALPTSIKDVAIGDNNVMYVLDNNNGKVFAYNDMLYSTLMIFGDIGDTVGTFLRPEAVEYFNGQVLVLDGRKGNITVFEPTGYGEALLAAIHLFGLGHFEEAAIGWNEVLKMNTNSSVAYAGLAMAYEASGDFRKAMEYYRYADLPIPYSYAKELYRREVIRNNFPLIVLGVVTLAAIYLFRSHIAKQIRSIIGKKAKGAPKWS